MTNKLFPAVVLLLAFSSCYVHAQSDANPLGFMVVAPDSLANQYPTGLRHSDALFGIPAYGGSIMGAIVYATPAENHTGCHPLEVDPAWPKDTPLIVMVDRGQCTFVQKVKNVESIGGVAAVIADNKCICGEASCAGVSYPDCDHRLPVMADDGNGASVQIPSYIITKAEAQSIKDCLSGTSTLAGCTAGGSVVVKLSWDLPRPDNKVEWEMWTSSDDTSGKKFKDEFENTAILLGPNTVFTPRYFIYDGSVSWRGCTQPGHPCGNQCVFGGKYCNPDPDRNMESGWSGADVVMENLRRICIWQQANKTYDSSMGAQWWQYVRTFDMNCLSKSPTEILSCSEAEQTAAGLSPSATSQCITDSSANGDNSLLKKELADRATLNMFILPTIVVNGVIERGGTNHQSVLTTICAGFLEGTEPEVCKCTELAYNTKLAECVKITGNTGSAPVPGNNSTSGMPFGSVMLVIVVVVVVMFTIGGIGYVHMKRQHESQLRSEVRNILQEYMPLSDDGPADEE